MIWQFLAKKEIKNLLKNVICKKYVIFSNRYFIYQQVYKNRKLKTYYKDLVQGVENIAK